MGGAIPDIGESLNTLPAQMKNSSATEDQKVVMNVNLLHGLEELQWLKIK